MTTTPGRPVDPLDPLDLAIAEARRGLSEGGVPIGAVLLAHDGAVLGAGCNGSVQHGDFLLHAEVAAVKAAGQLGDYSGTTLVTTMTPCWLCAGMVRFLGIPEIVVGDTETWSTDALDWLAASGVAVRFRGDRRCTAMFDDWLATDPPSWPHARRGGGDG